MRSQKNYAHRLAERLGARLVDLTVSGATTANIVDTPQQTAGGVVYPPQVDGVPADADVVTITAGGNDLQFAGAMLYAAWLRLEPESPAVPMLGAMFPDGVPLPTERAVEQAATGLALVIEKARAKAPAARVLLVDYLTVLDGASGPATGPDSPPGEGCPGSWSSPFPRQMRRCTGISRGTSRRPGMNGTASRSTVPRPVM
jgi:lysophospholipase L1-like esterase